MSNYIEVIGTEIQSKYAKPKVSKFSSIYDCWKRKRHARNMLNEKVKIYVHGIYINEKCKPMVKKSIYSIINYLPVKKKIGSWFSNVKKKLWKKR